jgi:hypothetical protein
VALYDSPGQYATERPYGYWVRATLAALALVVGPATVAGLRRVLVAGKTEPRAMVAVTLAGLLAMIIADLSG